MPTARNTRKASENRPDAGGTISRRGHPRPLVSGGRNGVWGAQMPRARSFNGASYTLPWQLPTIYAYVTLTWRLRRVSRYALNRFMNVILLDYRGATAHTHTFDDAGFCRRGSGLGRRQEILRFGYSCGACRQHVHSARHQPAQRRDRFRARAATGPIASGRRGDGIRVVDRRQRQTRRGPSVLSWRALGILSRRRWRLARFCCSACCRSCRVGPIPAGPCRSPIHL